MTSLSPPPAKRNKASSPRTLLSFSTTSTMVPKTLSDVSDIDDTEEPQTFVLNDGESFFVFSKRRNVGDDSVHEEKCIT